MSNVWSMMTWTTSTMIIVIVVIGIIYRIFGKGLAFRIFGLMMPVAAIVGLAGIMAGQISVTALNMMLVTVPTATILIVGLYYLYQSTVVVLKRNIIELQSASAQLSATASQSSSTASEQASIVSQVSTTIEEIAKTSAAGADSAQNIVSVTSEAMSQGQEGQGAIQNVLAIMTRIGQVNRIVDAVKQLAEQSNILAVNAGIEAAKAGEQGRGFAVVASEVRNLAEQTRQATKEIRDALELTDEGRQALESTSLIIQRLVGVLENASDRSRKIAGASMQQAAGIKQINEAVLSLNQTSQENASSSAQIKQSVDNLENIGSRIKIFVAGERASQESR